MHADCKAVTHATSRAEASVRDHFKYALYYKHEGHKALRKVVKDDAHKSREQSKSEGWEDHWRGNGAAHATAKMARPKLQCDAKTQRRSYQVLEEEGKIAECCKVLEGLWKEILTAKKACVKVSSNLRGKMGKLPHTVVYHKGKWMCSSCRCHFRKAPSEVAVVLMGKSCAGRSLLKEAASSSHSLHTATVGDGTGAGQAAEIHFRSQCGAYGRHKVMKLRERC